MVIFAPMDRSCTSFSSIRSEDRLQATPPYAMNAKMKPSTPLKFVGATAVVDVHRDEQEALDRQECGRDYRERQVPVEGRGGISPTVQTSSRMPRAFQTRLIAPAAQENPKGP
jgi:hypothetical protein